MMTSQIFFSPDKPRFWPVKLWILYFFLAFAISNCAGNRLLYYIDFQVFGGKLVKNSFTHFWVPFQSFHTFSCPFIYALSIIVWRCLKSHKVHPISAYLWNLSFFVARHVIEKISSTKKRNFAYYFRQRSWFVKKSVPQTVYLSSEVNKYTAELLFGSSCSAFSWRAH